MFSMLPPNTDGTIHTDEDMEAAHAVYKLGHTPPVLMNPDGTENKKSKKVREAWHCL